ncbi:MAG: transglycosylase SLT domain-containing protein [Deltaproteobacteria bacterium]|nr:transglycosylase SLT domain-containing protein [Deltaproteobacteria bacterium]
MMKYAALLSILAFSITAFGAENPPSPPVDWAQRYGAIDSASEASLNEAIKKEGPLSPWLSLRLSELYLRSEKYPEALNLLEKIPVGGIWDFWKKTALAKAWLGMNQPRQVLQELEALPPEPDVQINPTQIFYRQIYRDALWTKEQALRQMGKNADAVSARIWALFPDIDGNSANVRETPRISPDIHPAATTSDKITRLHVLHTKKLYDTIPVIVRPDEIAVSHLPLAEKCRALFEWGNSLRNLKKPAEALDGFSGAVSQKCDGEYLVRSLYWKGKLELAFKKPDRAIETYEYLIEKFPSGRYTDDAWYGLWKIYEEQKQEGRAKKAIRQLIALPEGDMRLEALWETAWPAYKKKKYREALELFDRILASPPRDDESYPRALYWKGRTLEKMGEASSSYYQRLIDDFPFSYYAVIAANRFGTTPNIPQIPRPHTEVPVEAKAQETIVTVNLLNELGLHREALDLLDYFSQQEADLAGQMKPLMAVKWIESGDYNKALAMASEHFGHGVTEGVKRKNDPMLFAFYPEAYAKEVEAANRRLQLPRGMIEGIMREESLFLPEVRSSAGAVGVMQLMPGTASIQARSTVVENFSMDSLTDPRTNILLGSSFFAKLVDRYEGHVPLAVMAYNAGPGNVNKWRARMGNLPLDEFVEEIPFSETRGYVKRVLRSMQIYGLLFDEPTFKKPFFSMNL